ELVVKPSIFVLGHIDVTELRHVKDDRDSVVRDHRKHQHAAGDVDASGGFPMHGAPAHLLGAAAWHMFHAHERRAVGGSRRLLRRVLIHISWRGRRSDLPRNSVLLHRLDHWNWRLTPRHIEENWTHVVLLGDRGRRARKKGRHRKGRECRVPFHESRSIWKPLYVQQDLPNHFLADFMCCLGSEILFSVSKINMGVMRIPLSRQSLAARQKAGWLMVWQTSHDLR